MPGAVDDRVWFVAERFERLRDLLFEHGYALDPRPSWDFDPAGHPEMPYHHHPPSRDSDRRRLGGPIDPREAIAAFHRWVDRQAP
jgi:hypothetical protein